MNNFIPAASASRCWLYVIIIIVNITINADFLAAETTFSKPVRFAVISDLHLLAPSLGCGGKAFDDEMTLDRKLIKQGCEIFHAAADDIIAMKPGFIIICGDLTKDGERDSHLLLSKQLECFMASGIKVLVIPGNHDIRNAMARRYRGDISAKTASITADEFPRIYAGCGYTAAITLDSASMSYVAEPEPGIWVMGIDSCQYDMNPAQGPPIAEGRIRDKTLEWMDQILSEAGKRRKTVIVFLHHGVLEHFAKQARLYPQYMLANRETFIACLNRHDVHFVFTGHFHANDITREGKLYDIETGSLITWPCAFRIIEFMPPNHMQLISRRIKAIPSIPSDFQMFAQREIFNRLHPMGIAVARKWLFTESDADIAAGIVADAYLAHYQGDESTYKPIGRQADMNLYSAALFFLYRRHYQTLTHDLEPADNNLTIDLNNSP